MEEEAKAAKEAVSAVGELIKLAGDDPQAREAARNLGQAAVTIAKTINTALLPLAAVISPSTRPAHTSQGNFSAT